MPLIVSMIFGFVCGKLVYSVYGDNVENRLSSSKIYLVQSGKYTSYDSMREENSGSNYVYYVDEEGYLYTAKCITELEEGATVDASTYSSFIHQFQVYDLNGTCVKEVELTIGTGINLLTAKEGTLYCISMK